MRMSMVWTYIGLGELRMAELTVAHRAHPDLDD